MLSGKSFRLNREVLAIENVDGRRTALTLPADAVIEVVSGPTPSDKRMVDVRWMHRELVMFAIDLQERGEEIPRSSVRASGT
jgi:hypothetical protein